MDTSSSHLPVCIHCGTARPADESLCPKCGNPWIDVSIQKPAGRPVPPPVKAPSASTPEIPPAVAAAAATPPSPAAKAYLSDTGEFDFDAWTLPPAPERSKARWFIPAILLMAVVAAWSLVLIGPGSKPTTTIADIAAPTTVVPTTVAPTTTVPPTTTSSTTTVPPTTTTVISYRSASDWTVSENALKAGDLPLRAGSIGPLAFGRSLAITAEVLVATLGTPTAAGYDTSACPTAEQYWLSWGGLTTYFDGYEDSSIFVAYRYGASPDDSGPDLATLSGVEVGDTVKTLLKTYSSYTVSFEVVEDKQYFRLLEGGDLLLWGPVSSSEPTGIVEGINSPEVCGETQ